MALQVPEMRTFPEKEDASWHGLARPTVARTVYDPNTVSEQVGGGGGGGFRLGPRGWGRRRGRVGVNTASASRRRRRGEWRWAWRAGGGGRRGRTGLSALQLDEPLPSAAAPPAAKATTPAPMRTSFVPPDPLAPSAVGSAGSPDNPPGTARRALPVSAVAWRAAAARSASDLAAAPPTDFARVASASALAASLSHALARTSRGIAACARSRSLPAGSATGSRESSRGQGPHIPKTA